MITPLPKFFTQRVESLQEERMASVLRDLDADADAAAEQEQQREIEKMVALRQIASTVAELAIGQGIKTDFTFHETVASKRRRVIDRAFEIEPFMAGWKLAESEHSSWDSNNPYATQLVTYTYKGIVLCIDGEPRSYSTTSKYPGAKITGANFSDRLTGDGQWRLGIALESGLARFVAENNLTLPTQPAQDESSV